MWRKLLDIIVMSILGIISTDSNYLIIFLPLYISAISGYSIFNIKRGVLAVWEMVGVFNLPDQSWA